MATVRQVDVGTALREPLFTGRPGGSPGFGGPSTVFNHAGGPVGSLELTPHGAMHVAVGGWMSAFNTAGLDPIFWLHHANIDRLWAVWRARDTGHRDPTVAQWRTSLSFSFRDARGRIVSLRPAQVVDTTAPPLGYRYEDVSDPLGGGLEGIVEGIGRQAMEREAIPEMVGATEEPVVLTGRPAATSVAVSAPTGPGLESLETGTAPRVFLNLENITGQGRPTSYAVYINLPAGANPEDHQELFAGILPMFGVAEATRPDRGHAGSGLHYALEVGDVVRRLEARNQWDPNDVRVAFVPEGESASTEEGLESAATEPIRVGRVSIYYA
jgi:tyrosinase